MPHHSEVPISPYSTEKLFALVADIERYPEFLPWCRAARIVKREKNLLLAELVISFQHLTESYTSEVTLHPPEHPGAEAAIEAKMVEGPFEYLTNHWKFIPTSAGGTRIELELDFQFRSRMLNMLIGSMFDKAVARMAEAFKKRADDLYGSSEPLPLEGGAHDTRP